MNDLFKPLTGGPLLASVAAAAPAGPVATATAALSTLPPALADLTAGTVIAGIVVERARGQVLLKTDKGMLQLQTNLPLKLGASVVLEVLSVGAQVRIAIVSVDQHAPALAASEPPAPGIGAGTQAAVEREPATPPTVQRGPTPPLVGRTVTATVIGPPDARAAAEPADPTLPMLLRRLIAISALTRAAADGRTPDQTPSFPAASATLASPLARALPSTPANVAATADAPAEPLLIPSAEELEAALKTLPAPAREIVAALLDDGLLTAAKPETEREANTPAKAPLSGAPHPDSQTTSSDARARGAAPPSPRTVAIRILAQSLAPSTAALRPQVAPQSDSITLVGTVLSDDATGTEIATPIGRLRLPIPAALPQGARIVFEVLSRAATDAMLAAPERAAEALAQPIVETTRDWSAAREIVARWPEAAEALLPKAGQPIGPALLAFIAAVRGGGNVKAWLGTRLAAAAEETPEKKELVSRLGQDLAAQARSAAAHDSEGWRTIAVPVVDAGRLSELRFRFRKRDRRDGDADDGGSRFVVQARLSALGPLQLDGLVRARRFDLVVRTARSLSAPMRRDISELFARALADGDYRGEIRFRSDAFELAPGSSGHGSGVVA